MNTGSEGNVLERRPIFWFYGSSSIAYGIKDNAFSYLLLTFANQALGVPGYLASLALAIAIVWDALTDPLLGHWSDKTQSKLGRRHPFMYAALFILPASFYALFNPLLDVRGEDAFWYVFVLAILIRTGTTLFEVPCTALLPDLEKDYDRRNRWLAVRHLWLDRRQWPAHHQRDLLGRRLRVCICHWLHDLRHRRRGDYRLGHPRFQPGNPASRVANAKAPGAVSL